MASLALIGWCLDRPLLERCFTHAVTMNPMSAIAMLLAGLSLAKLPLGPRRLREPAYQYMLPTLVLAIASTKMSDLVLSTTFHADSRLFVSEMARAVDHNKMAPNTALSLILLSCALLLVPLGRRFSAGAAQILVLSSCFLALLALVGYTYGVSSFFGLGRFTPMSIPAAMCFISLGASVLASTCRVGLMRCICNPGPSGRMAIVLMPASFLIPLPLGIWRLMAMRLHLVTDEFAISMSTVIIISMLVCVTWIGAQWLYLSDLQREAAEQELRYRASRDFLTGLVNRSVFFDRLQQRLLVMRRHASPRFAIFYLDVDGFKQVNDQLGHEAGDRFLTQVARVLEACTRGSDTVARLGGDEFAILFHDIEQPSDVKILADRIASMFPPYAGDGPEIPVGISIGIAVSQASYLSPQEILRDADTALYAVKRSGKGRAQVHAQPADAPVLPPSWVWNAHPDQTGGLHDEGNLPVLDVMTG